MGHHRAGPGQSATLVDREVVRGPREEPGDFGDFSGVLIEMRLEAQAGVLSHERFADLEQGFRRGEREARGYGVEQTAASMEAVKTLLELQKTPAPPAVRLGAARSVIELGTKLRETAEFEARLAALEQRIEPKERA